MAETPEEISKRIAELFEKGIFPKFKDLESNIQSLNSAATDSNKLDRLNLTAKKKAQEEEKIFKNREAALSKSYAAKVNEIYQEAKKGDITRAEAQQKIIELRDKVGQALANPELQQAFEKQAKAVERNAKTNEMITSEFAQVVKQNWSSGIKALGSSFGSVMQSYQSGSSQIGMAANVLQQSAGLAGSAISGAGAAAGAAGTAMAASSNKYAKGIGVALSVIGPAASLAGSALSKTASTVLPFLQAEMEKNIAAFQSLSASGALFSNGLDGMIRAAGQGGLTLAQLDSIVKNSKESIAALGEGVGAGTLRITRALGAGGDGLRKNLLNLGFTVEEQGSLVAETMAAMRQSGGKLTSSDAVVAEQTKKYAENLRIVSDITGEDAKKKQAQIQQENSRLAVQQKLAGLSEEQRAAFGRAQLNMSDMQRQALQEMIASGGQIVTPELAATVAQMPNLKASLDEMFNSFQQGSLDEKTVRNIQAERGEAIKKEMLSQTELGLAGIANVGGLAQKIAESMGKELEFRNKVNSDSIQSAEENAKKQAEALSKQQEAMTNAIIKNQELMMQTQQAVMDTGVMKAYGSAVSTATDALIDMVKAFRKEFGGPETNVGKEKAKADIESAGKTGETIGSVAGTVIGGAIGSLGGPVGTAIGAAAGGFIGEILGGWAGKYLAGTAKGSIAETNAVAQQQQQNPVANSGTGITPGWENIASPFAKGGIANAPVTGMPAVLHGRELVLPLPDNLKIEKLAEALTDKPTVDPASLMSMASTQPSYDKDIVESNKEMNAYLKTLIEQFGVMERSLDAIATNTDRTARGVA